jgi:hypothetical protein
VTSTLPLVYAAGFVVAFVWFVVRHVIDDQAVPVDQRAPRLLVGLALGMVIAAVWPVWLVAMAVFWLVDGPD